MKKKILFLSFASLFLAYPVIAQENFGSQRFFNTHVSRKGTFYTSWGYNRAAYTYTYLHLKGDNYDFTLEKVKAKDSPERFTLEQYFKPVSLTIPQYNFTVGYYFNDRHSISFNVDHMKYVMIQNQTVKIDGSITETGNQFSGVYNSQNIELTPDFLTFEHTDGLNYVNLAGNGIQEIYGSRNRKFIVSAIGGFGAGILYPKSNVKLFSYGRNDEFHLAGFGISGQVGLNVMFWQKVFVQFNGKGGYIDMPDIVTRGKHLPDRAKQDFYFLQGNLVFGVQFKLKKS